MTQEQAPSCESCGMPMKEAADHGLGDVSQPRCKYCVNPDGSYRSYDEVYEGCVGALMRMRDLSREEAEKQARYLDNLPAWKNG